MTPIEREVAILDRVRAQLEAERYEVILQPSPLSLPDFLQDLRPDGVAHRGDKHIVIEIVSRALKTEARIRMLRHALTNQEGWQLRVIWTSGHTVPRSPEIPSHSSIRATLEEIDSLMETGHLRPALLLAWASLEALGRTLIPSALEKPQTPRRLVEYLAEGGYLDRAEASYLRRLSEGRNRLIHGDLDTDVTRDEVREMIGVLWRLSEDVIE